jgi:large subunit ribosomal protein L29
MKSKELRDMGVDELRGKLDEAYHELFNLRFQLASRQLTNTCRLGQVRRDVARIKTIMRERELEEAGVR